MMSEFTSLISSQLSLRSTGCDARAHHTSIALDVTREWSLGWRSDWSQSERKRETPQSLTLLSRHLLQIPGTAMQGVARQLRIGRVARSFSVNKSFSHAHTIMRLYDDVRPSRAVT